MTPTAPFRALLLTVLLSAAAAQDTLQTTVPPAADSTEAPADAAPPPRRQIVRQVQVKGNLNVNTGLITGNFLIKPGGRYNAREAQESIRALYEMGLFSDITLEAEDASGDSFDLVIAVRECPVLDKVEFSGNDKIDSKDLEEKISLLPGAVITDAALHKARNVILDAYREKGFLLAAVEPQTFESKEGGRTIVEFKIEEGKKVAIKQISLNGVSVLPEKKVLAAMEDTKEDRWWRSGDFDEEKFYKDLTRIEEYYHTEGFLDAKIVDHAVSYTDDKKGLYLTINLSEGRRYFFGNVYFSGNELFDDAALLKSVTLKRGELFNRQQYELSRFQLESMYREEGYLYVQMNEEKAYRGDTIDLTFRVREGMPAYINRVIVAGNTKTWDKVIRREIQLRPGDIYRQSLLQLSQRDLLQTNYFDQANPDIQTNPDRSVDLLFNVQEKESGTGQVSAGAGYSQRDGFVFTTGLSMPNFAISRPFIEGGGQTVDLQAEWGKYSRRLDLGFTEPWFRDTPTLTGFRGYYWWRDWDNDITETRKGGELRLGRRLKWPDLYFNFYSSYNFSYREYLFDNESYADQTIQGVTIKYNGFESALALRLSRNSTDLPDFPTRGSVVEYNPTFAGGPLGGDYSYIKHRVGVQLFLPTFLNLTLLQGATVAHLDGSVIGRYDHFLAGGVNYEGVIRGYPDRAFGDLVVGSDQVGYNLVVLTTELRYPILERRLYASVFADFGNTWASLNRVDFSDLKTGVGAGVKLMVPMLGLIGFDVGLGLSDYPEDRASPVDDYGNTITHRQATGEKPPYFEFHFRIGKM